MVPVRLKPLFFGVSLALAGAGASAQPGEPKPPTAGLSDEAELTRVITLYTAGKYAECVREFDGLIGGDARKIEDAEVLERARVYYAACLIGSGQIPRAEDQMRAAIRANPQMRVPDSLVFPAPVIDRFIQVRDSLREEIKKAEAAELEKKRAAAEAAAKRAAAEKRRVERLEDYAKKEVVVERSSRWVAAVPFGVGQFQNRDPVLGWLFLGSEVLLAATAFTAVVIELDLNAKSDDDPPPDPDDLNSKLDTAHQVLTVSTWSFVSVAAVGVLQAQLAFVPEFRTATERPLPPELRRPKESAKLELLPLAVPTAHGFELGVAGRF